MSFLGVSSYPSTICFAFYVPLNQAGCSLICRWWMASFWGNRYIVVPNSSLCCHFPKFPKISRSKEEVPLKLRVMNIPPNHFSKETLSARWNNSVTFYGHSSIPKRSPEELPGGVFLVVVVVKGTTSSQVSPQDIPSASHPQRRQGVEVR